MNFYSNIIEQLNFYSNIIEKLWNKITANGFKIHNSSDFQGDKLGKDNKGLLILPKDIELKESKREKM